jgi:hypothetical protein
MSKEGENIDASPGHVDMNKSGAIRADAAALTAQQRQASSE